ncbi:helix-turn-helix domain-containing protein [Salinicola halophilus]|uniref:helix-turn-helix domain-containing protein n=1 Tax=Salinicola halophilus TaxID=184065 RepID=UPI000DA24715|nr:AraC family transcriptional regulator [Salinicola halophilus]
MTDSIRQTPLDTAVHHHHHEHHQIVIGLAGYAEFEIGHQSGVIAPLSGCLVPANVEHYYQGIGENRQLIIDLDDDADALTGAHRSLRRLFDRPGYFTLDESLTHYLQFLLQESARPRHMPTGLLVTTLLSALQTRIEDQQPSRMRDSRRTRTLDIARLERYVQSHLHRRIQVADLARLVCLSEAHFSERFRNQTGLTPYQFVLRQRLASARELILADELSLAVIAERAGFASQSALSHAFRRHYGHPPIALRARYR